MSLMLLIVREAAFVPRKCPAVGDVEPVVLPLVGETPRAGGGHTERRDAPLVGQV